MICEVDTLAWASGPALAALAGNIHLHETQELVLKAAFWAATQQLAAVSLQNSPCYSLKGFFTTLITFFVNALAQKPANAPWS